MWNLSNKYGEQLLDTATKTGLDVLKTASEKVFHKAAKATDGFIVKNIADKIVEPKPVPDKNSRNVEEMIIPTEKKRKNIEWIKTGITKWNTIKYLNY